MKDATQELRAIAAEIESAMPGTANKLRTIATQYEVVSGAYVTAARVRDTAGAFLGWFNRHYPDPSGNESHPWNELGRALGEQHS